MLKMLFILKDYKELHFCPHTFKTFVAHIFFLKSEEIFFDKYYYDTRDLQEKFAVVEVVFYLLFICLLLMKLIMIHVKIY